MIGMGVPAESFVICFEARVSPRSISFSYTLFDGLRFSLGMTNNQRDCASACDLSHPQALQATLGLHAYTGSRRPDEGFGMCA